MARHARKIVIDPPRGINDPGSSLIVQDVEHPGIDEDGNPIIERRTVFVAGPDGHSVTNPATGVTAVWVPGEVVADWAVELANE